MRIRVEEERDRGRVREMITRAFGQTDEAVLVDALRRDPSWIPELSLVADEGTGPLGHVLFTHLSVDGKPGAVALAPIAVEPDRHRQGIGIALVQNGLLAARRLGHSLVIVMGHPSYYPRFGFVPARSLGLDAPAGWNPPNDAWLAMRLSNEAPTGPVVYPKPFGELS